MDSSLLLFCNILEIYIFYKNLLRINIREINRSESILHLAGKSNSDHVQASKCNGEKISINLKILINYFQMISLIYSLELKWPFYLNEYLKTTSRGLGISTQFPIDCLFSFNNTGDEFLHTKTILKASLPFILYLLVLLVLFFHMIISNVDNTPTFLPSLMIICILLQPYVLHALLENVNFIQLDNKNYLVAQLTLNYDLESHQKWVFFFIFF